jgi:hypothetical protein
MTTSESLPILLHLDLATDNPIDERELLALVPAEDRERVISLRASEHGARRSANGTPQDWMRSCDAITTMAQSARERAKAEGKARYYVAGRAALPLFAHLGCELSKWADVTLMNRRDSPVRWDVLRLGTGERPFSESDRFFEEQTGLEKRVEASGLVSVTVATSPPRQDDPAARYVASHRQIGTVRLAAHRMTATGPKAGFLDESNVSVAAHELHEAFRALPGQFPNAQGATVFIDGPTTLAFLVGRALNPNVLSQRVAIPNFNKLKGGGYYDAVTLPHDVQADDRESDAVPVVVLHASADDHHLAELRKRLAATAGAGQLRVWHRGAIPPGKSVEEETRVHLSRARFVLPLLSPDFLADRDLAASAAKLLSAQDALGKHVVPILLRPCSLSGTVYETAVILPRNRRPVSSWSSDDAWYAVHEDIAPMLRAACEADAKARA